VRSCAYGRGMSWRYTGEWGAWAHTLVSPTSYYYEEYAP
jgi:hypothetical protein